MKRFLFASIMVFLMTSAASAAYLEPSCTYQGQAFIQPIYVEDLFGDGASELIVGFDDGQLKDFNRSSIVSCAGQWTPTWSHLVEGGGDEKIVGIEILDIDADGKKELVLAASDSKKYLTVLASKGGFFEWQDSVAGGPAVSLDVCDIDSDGGFEIVLGKEKEIAVLEGADSVKWTYPLDDPAYFVGCTDLDGDGASEIVVLSGDRLYGGEAKVHVLGPAGSLKWDYAIDGGVFLASKETVSVSDLDGNQKQEIVLATSKGVVALGPGGSLLWTYPTERLVNAVYTAEVDSDGRKEVLAGSNPYLYVLSSSGSVKSTIDIGGPAKAIRAADLESDGVFEIVAGTNQDLKVLNPAGSVKGSWGLGKDISQVDLAIADLDGDGVSEIIAGMGWYDSRLDKNYPASQLTVLKVSGPGAITQTTQATSTTVPASPTTSVSTLKKTTTTRYVPATTLPAKGGSGFFGIPFIWIAVVLGLLFVGAVGLLAVTGAGLFFWKKKKEKSTTGEEETVEAPAEEEKTEKVKEKEKEK